MGEHLKLFDHAFNKAIEDEKKPKRKKSTTRHANRQISGDPSNNNVISDASYSRDTSVGDHKIGTIVTQTPLGVKVTEAAAVIESEDIVQSHRKNLQWAIKAAGKFLRTKQKPETCPNDAAFFLFMQAIDQPKEFMAKVTQIESKQEEEEEADIKKSCKRSIEEIEKILEKL